MFELLNNTISWLETSPDCKLRLFFWQTSSSYSYCYLVTNDPWKGGLIARIRLRKVFYKIALLGITAYVSQILLSIFSGVTDGLSETIAIGQGELEKIKTLPQPQIRPNSKVRLAFNPSVMKLLPSFLPLPTIECMTISESRETVSGLLQGRRRLIALKHCDSLLEWMVCEYKCQI